MIRSRTRRACALLLALTVSVGPLSTRAQPAADGGVEPDAGAHRKGRPALDAGAAGSAASSKRHHLPDGGGASHASPDGGGAPDASPDGGLPPAASGEGREVDGDGSDEESLVESDVDEAAEEELLEQALRAQEAKPATQPDGSPIAPVPLPEFVEKLPEPISDVVQGAANQMAESRAPPNNLLYGIFGIPRSRFGTGTSWLPDGSPLYAAVPHVGRWGLLVSGTVFTGYNWYSSKRGGRRFMGRNTLVGSMFRTFQRSEVQFRLAMSFEPITIGERGYPQILQSGQTADGKRIHDTQYALDFFREFATMYTWEVTRNWAGTFYAALAGEPALGPVTFTQRISASADPLAPLGFQAQEASHASFGVITIGGHTRTLKIEASWFNGEVPGKHRYTLALRKPDSYSLRVSWNPGVHWSGQLSYGFLERPVPSDPRHQHRVSSSMTYTKWSANDAGFAATLSFAERIDTNLNSGAALMLEAYWNIDGNNAVFGRAELLQKSARELVLQTTSDELYAVGSIAGGYIYYFGPYLTLQPGLGVRLSLNPMENDLAREYGTQVAYGAMGFAQLRTSALPVPSRP